MNESKQIFTDVFNTFDNCWDGDRPNNYLLVCINKNDIFPYFKIVQEDYPLTVLLIQKSYLTYTALKESEIKELMFQGETFPGAFYVNHSEVEYSEEHYKGVWYVSLKYILKLYCDFVSKMDKFDIEEKDSIVNEFANIFSSLINLTQMVSLAKNMNLIRASFGHEDRLERLY